MDKENKLKDLKSLFSKLVSFVGETNVSSLNDFHVVAFYEYISLV